MPSNASIAARLQSDGGSRVETFCGVDMLEPGDVPVVALTTVVGVGGPIALPQKPLDVPAPEDDLEVKEGAF